MDIWTAVDRPTGYDSAYGADNEAASLWSKTVSGLLSFARVKNKPLPAQPKAPARNAPPRVGASPSPRPPALLLPSCRLPTPALGCSGSDPSSGVPLTPLATLPPRKASKVVLAGADGPVDSRLDQHLQDGLTPPLPPLPRAEPKPKSNYKWRTLVLTHNGLSKRVLWDPKEALGSGGFGSVSKAFWCGPRGVETVAVKTMPTATTKQQVSYLAEIFAAQQLARMPGVQGLVPALKWYGVNGQQGYIAFECARGGDLQNSIGTQGLPLRNVLQVGEATARILKELDNVDACHCDIKPANIFLDAPLNDSLTPATLIGDWGCSMWEGGDIGLGGCTPVYAAPEVRQGHLGVQGDLYSLGLTMLHACVGERFRAMSVAPRMALAGQLNYLRARGEAGSDLASLIERITAVEPGDRPMVSDVLDEIRLLKEIHSNEIRGEVWPPLKPLEVSRVKFGDLSKDAARPAGPLPSYLLAQIKQKRSFWQRLRRAPRAPPTQPRRPMAQAPPMTLAPLAPPQLVLSEGLWSKLKRKLRKPMAQKADPGKTRVAEHRGRPQALNKSNVPRPLALESKAKKATPGKPCDRKHHRGQAFATPLAFADLQHNIENKPFDQGNNDRARDCELRGLRPRKTDGMSAGAAAGAEQVPLARFNHAQGPNDSHQRHFTIRPTSGHRNKTGLGRITAKVRARFTRN